MRTSKQWIRAFRVASAAILLLCIVAIALHSRKLNPPSFKRAHIRRQQRLAQWRLAQSRKAALPTPVAFDPALPYNNTATNPENLVTSNISTKPAAPLHLPYALWWFAPFFTGTGYGLEAQHYMLALLRAGLVQGGDLWISQHGDFWDKGFVHIMQEHDRQQLQVMMENPSDHRSRTAIMVCHSLPNFWSGKGPPLWEPPGKPCPAPPGRSVYSIGRTMCEVDGIPLPMTAQCNKMDEIWVPSQWAREVFISSGVTASKLVVVPEGVDTQKFDPARYEAVPLPVGQLVLGRRQQRAVGGRPYVFLSTFKWESRKGYDVLLKAYLQEFRPTEAVELYIMTRPFAGSGDNFLKLVRSWVADHLPPPPTPCADPNPNRTEPCKDFEAPLHPTVYVIEEHIPDDQLPRHFKAADCFVLPSRGEGWGRPQVEAMSMGLPVISTNWSGMTAYLDPSVGFPLRWDNLTDADKDNAPYFQGFKWAQPSGAHLRELLRWVVEHPQEAAAKGRAARERMIRDFSSEVVGLKVVRELLRITRTLQLRGAPLEIEGHHKET